MRIHAAARRDAERARLKIHVGSKSTDSAYCYRVWIRDGTELEDETNRYRQDKVKKDRSVADYRSVTKRQQDWFFAGDFSVSTCRSTCCELHASYGKRARTTLAHALVRPHDEPLREIYTAERRASWDARLGRRNYWRPHLVHSLAGELTPRPDLR